MELIIAEKASLARDIARALCGRAVSPTAPLPISGNGITVTAASGHLLELVDPEEYNPRLAQRSGLWTEADLPIYFPDWKKCVRYEKIDYVSAGAGTGAAGKGAGAGAGAGTGAGAGAGAAMSTPRKPDPQAAARLEQIRALMEKADSVTNAGDPDDEGQALVDEIIDYLGWKGPEERLYVNDSLEKNIRRAYAEKRPNNEARGDGEAAYARAIADATFGFSNSRLLSSRLRLGNVSVGRVQTPTLGLVVNRDRAIEAHADTKFYQVVATLGEGTAHAGNVPEPAAAGAAEHVPQGGATQFPGPQSGPAQPDIEAPLTPTPAFMEDNAADGKHVLQRPPVEKLGQDLAANGACVMKFKTKNETTEPPKPYNITDLEADMNRRFGFKAADTLAYTQSLRDNYNAITYNRTSSSYLKEEHWKEAPAVLGLAMKNVGLTWPVDFTLKTKAFDDSKVTAHHGMIPTERAIDVSRMSREEALVYRAIVERYAAQFLPARVVRVCQGVAETPQGTLRYTAKRIVTEGWKAIMGAGAVEAEDEAAEAEAAAQEAEEIAKPLFEDGEYTFRIKRYAIAEKVTTPPRPYTEATLLKDMASIARYVENAELRAVLKKKDEDSPDEHGGIGTSATRPAIIEALKRHQFIEESGKKIVSTKRGRAVYDLIPAELKVADTTALWWLIQEDVRLGGSHNAVAESVVEQFNRIKGNAYKGVVLPAVLLNRKPRGPVVGKCPRCGEDIWAAEKLFVCSSIVSRKQEDGSWAEVSGCGWKVFRSFCGKDITDTQMKQMLSGKVVRIKGLKSRMGDVFEADVQLGATGGAEGVGGASGAGGADGGGAGSADRAGSASSAPARLSYTVIAPPADAGAHGKHGATRAASAAGSANGTGAAKPTKAPAAVKTDAQAKPVAPAKPARRPKSVPPEQGTLF